jgi:HEAT repeat protein
MSRLAILYGGLFALLILLPSTPDTARLGHSEAPREDSSASVQLEEPREAIQEEKVQAKQGVESEWVESGNSDSVPLLIRYLRSHEEIVQLAALAEFAAMSPKAKSAVPAILEVLNDPKSFIRVKAAATLIHMNVQSQAAVGALRKELKAKNATDRASAVRIIGELVEPPDVLVISCWGPGLPPRVARPWIGKQILPALKEALRDQDPKVRAEVAHTLRLIRLHQSRRYARSPKR